MSEGRAFLTRIAPLLLLLLLAVTVVLNPTLGLSLASADEAPAAEMRAALDALPEDPVVLVGFDPDLGTYAEIRPTVRTLLADLLNRGATLAFISLTPEGRALGLAELQRMDRRETNPRQLVDLGFVPGAEAALVGLARELSGTVSNPISTDVPAGEGLAGASLAVVVGGIDMGPRSWVEQVSPRTEGLALVGVAPAALLPELQPFRDSGQLAALLATPRDGAAYRAAAELGPLERLVEPEAAPASAIAVGLLAALTVLGASFATRLRGGIRAMRSRGAA